MDQTRSRWPSGARSRLLGVAVSLAACGDAPHLQATTSGSDDGSTVGSDAAGEADTTTNAGAGDESSSEGGDGPAQPGTTITRLHLLPTAGAQVGPTVLGHVFAPGDVPEALTLRAERTDLSEAVPLQVEVKARHPDGSLRHAVLVIDAPVPAATAIPIDLVTTPADPPETIELTTVLASGEDTKLDVVLDDGATYSASAFDMLTYAGTTQWLAGPLVGEWIASGPLRDAGGQAHPHLSAVFAVRADATGHVLRTSVTVENAWAFAAQPQNYAYDAHIEGAGGTTVDEAGLTHYRQSRWRAVLEPTPPVFVQHDRAYLIDSGAFPHYDPALEIGDTEVDGLSEQWAGTDQRPLQTALLNPYMPTTGGRPDIGPHSAWTVTHLLALRPETAEVEFGQADLAGAWPIHYRDQDTGLPVTIDDYPYMTLLGNPGDTVNPETGESEAFPDCAAECGSPMSADSAHQPSFAFVPYALTGDPWYLDELQLWANYNLLQSNPAYRETTKGLITPDQVRGQAWSLRTLAHAAWITPDDHPLKLYFETKLDNNVQWYAERYVDGDPNPLGIIEGNAFAYDEGLGVAPWQDDFMTWSLGYVAQLGYLRADEVAAWKSSFVVSRMTDPGYCWIFAGSYSLDVRSAPEAAIEGDWAVIYAMNVASDIAGLECGSADMGAAIDLAPGEMTGYAASPDGYPSNMQPALAAAVDSGVAGASEGWATFAARPVQPDYASYPNWAIVPRE